MYKVNQLIKNAIYKLKNRTFDTFNVEIVLILLV